LLLLLLLCGEANGMPAFGVCVFHAQGSQVSSSLLAGAAAGGIMHVATAASAAAAAAVLVANSFLLSAEWLLLS